VSNRTQFTTSVSSTTRKARVRMYRGCEQQNTTHNLTESSYRESKSKDVQGMWATELNSQPQWVQLQAKPQKDHNIPFYISRLERSLFRAHVIYFFVILSLSFLSHTAENIWAQFENSQLRLVSPSFCPQQQEWSLLNSVLQTCTKLCVAIQTSVYLGSFSWPLQYYILRV